MIQQKTILQGALHFGSEKSFVRAKRMYEGRLETYYKNELVFKELDHFNEILYTFDVPRIVTTVTDKQWRNTIDAMSFLGQFALCGKMEAYQTDSGKILKQEVVTPNNEKQSVRDYWKANLLYSNGEYDDALKAIKYCLAGYSKHTQAIELAARIHTSQGQTEKGIELFTKALKTDPKTYTAIFSRGELFYEMEEYEKALADFDNALKHSLAVLDIHWRSRLEKARCLIELGSHESARKELHFFLHKQFEPASDNYLRRREALLLHGRSLLDTGDHKEAIDFFTKALDHKEGEKIVSAGECMYFRGLAKKGKGLDNFSEDLERATEMGFAVK